MPLKKCVWTLCVNGFSPEITALTFPFMERYAKKIGAEFKIISERKFPDWPVVYEKLQIHELGRDYDWNLYIDADALVGPDMFDPTDHLSKDTVCHNGRDMAGNRWRYDHYFRRDSRHIGCCNWFTAASDWCLDLWRPLDDLTFEQARDNIFPVVSEVQSECFTKDHLIDDYTLSRNVARFGLKFTTVQDIARRIGDSGQYLWHAYIYTPQEKVREMKKIMRTWGIST
jgi:hypothetical protein